MKKPLIVIFVTVFIYLLGFGMIIPVLPLLSTHYGATPFQAGLIMSSFSLMQFLFSPFWGKLSDHYGRRPILIYCLIGEALSYLLLAYARSLEMILLSRILTGFFGASISTASAYVSDVTTETERTKGMAAIGAAFGLGFLFGPAIGGGLTVLAEKFTQDKNMIISFSALPVAVLCLLTSIFAYFFLTEVKVISKHSKSLLKRFSEIYILFKKPIINKLLLTMAFTSLSMAMMESTLVLFMKDRFQWSIKEVSFGFAYVGICIVLTQGVFVRRLVPKFGERTILRTGLALMALGFGLLGFSGQSMTIIGIAMTSLSIGNAFANPTLLGSISLTTPKEDQGLSMGATQSLSALGRVLGPALGTFIFSSLSISAPFWFSAILILCALAVVILNYHSLPNMRKA